jgi:hypothetical protein
MYGNGAAKHPAARRKTPCPAARCRDAESNFSEQSQECEKRNAEMNRQIDRKSGWWRLLCAAPAMAILLGSFLPLQAMPNQETQNDCGLSLSVSRDELSRTKPIVITMDDLQKHPEQYYGKTVTVYGELNKTFTENLFTIEGRGLLADKDILVIRTVPADQDIIVVRTVPKEESSQSMRVTGLVQPYERGKLECAYGPLQLENQERPSFTRNPVLIIEKTDAVPAGASDPELTRK